MHCSELQKIKSCALVQLEQHVRIRFVSRARGSRLTQTSKTVRFRPTVVNLTQAGVIAFLAGATLLLPHHTVLPPHMTHFFPPHQWQQCDSVDHCMSPVSLYARRLETPVSPVQLALLGRIPPFFPVLFPYSAEDKDIKYLNRRTLLEWNRKCAKLEGVCGSYALQLTLWHLLELVQVFFLFVGALYHVL